MLGNGDLDGIDLRAFAVLSLRPSAYLPGSSSMGPGAGEGGVTFKLCTLVRCAVVVILLCGLPDMKYHARSEDWSPSCGFCRKQRIIEKPLKVVV